MSDDTDRTSNRLPQEGGRDQLMVSIARMTYQQNKTLTEIAAETGLNRWQVSRLLQEARDLGIVRIEIVPRTLRHPDLEARLIHAFGLQDAVVVPGPAEEGPDGVAQAAGQYLAALKPKPRSIGVSCTRSPSISAIERVCAPVSGNGSASRSRSLPSPLSGCPLRWRLSARTSISASALASSSS